LEERLRRLQGLPLKQDVPNVAGIVIYVQAKRDFSECCPFWMLLAERIEELRATAYIDLKQ
jgi:hypothetical protein